MEKVRIASGIYRGREIATPGAGTHPMGAREKLALFNMIADILPGATVLDAYAGSGALGIEALSRGAREVVFVEKSPRACQVIRQNLSSLGLQGEVVKSNMTNFADERQFDMVLADPPYDQFDTAEIQGLGRFVKAGGTLVLSHPGNVLEVAGLKLEKTRQYAAAHLSVYVK